MTGYLNSEDARLARDREATALSLMAVAQIDRAEAEARAARLTDPKYGATLAEVREQLGFDTLITNVEDVGDTVVVSVAPSTAGIASVSIPKKLQPARDREHVKAQREMRENVARFEVARAYKRKTFSTALHLLISKGYYAPVLFWPALNPHRDAELQRQREAIAARVASEMDPSMSTQRKDSPTSGANKE